MKRFTIIVAVSILAGAGYFSQPSSAGSSPTPCKRTDFKTAMVRKACEAGGQKQAKKVMKAFVKKAKKKDSKINCKSCHSSLKSDYKLKADGLKLYQKLGGK